MNEFMHRTITRKRKKPLGRVELVAVALGGMVGGGIFSILGIAVDIIGSAAPIAIVLGGVFAFLAAYSYVKLALFYKDEGATYSFFKKTFTQNHFATSAIGWLVVFGYISTLALYAFTFASYFVSIFHISEMKFLREIVAGSIIAFFAIVNILSVKGMGKIEDLLVYTKIAILFVISGLFIAVGDVSNLSLTNGPEFSVLSVFIVASLTFVAFEGFQLVIHAYNETDNPDKNVPFAIYMAIAAALGIYLVLAIGAISAIPKELLIRDKEFALAAGASQILGSMGQVVVIFGALLATSSAISGTLFGASRLMSVIAGDGYLPKTLSHRRQGQIPTYSIIAMSFLAFILILTGGLETILEFGSITFIVVSTLMALANFKIRHQTGTHATLAITAILGLSVGAICLLYYKYVTEFENLIYILCLYGILMGFAFLFSVKVKKGNP